MSNKRRVKTVVKKQVKVSYDDSVKALIQKQNALNQAFDTKMKEMIEKHNAMAASVQACEQIMKHVLTTCSAEVGKVAARLEVLSSEADRSLQGMDRNVLAMAEMVKEVFGQLRQADFFMQKLAEASKTTLEVSDDDAKVIKDEAEKWFREITTSAFDTVQQRFIDEEKERMIKAAEEQKAKEAAESAALDVEEKDRIEKEGKRATAADRSILAQMGGPGADIPEGAEIFGGP